MLDAPVLTLEALSVRFAADRGEVVALEDVSFAVSAGETLALVGESGSGKSVTSLSILRLLPPSGRIAGGRILFRGWSGETVDLATADEAALRAIRGAGVSMVFQEPMSALNPAFTIGAQIAETIALHQRVPWRDALARAETALAKVGIAEPARRLGQYPHQLSGGMRQRAMIAMAVACRPALLIADEPTTALDVTTQARVLELIAALQVETGMAVLFVTHNLALVPMIASRVVVMYAGQIVEAGAAGEVLAGPKHPYTRALLECLPARHLPRDAAAPRPLPTIEGSSAVRPAAGCAFAPRCPLATLQCETGEIVLRAVGADGRLSRCLRAELL